MQVSSQSISEARIAHPHTFRGAPRAPPLLCVQRRWRAKSTNSAAGFPKSIAEEIRDIHRETAGSGPSAEHYRHVPGEDDGQIIVPVDDWLSRRPKNARLTGVYALYDRDNQLQFVGHSDDICHAIRGHRVRVGSRRTTGVRAVIMESAGSLSERGRALLAQRWIEAADSLPPGNGRERQDWSPATVAHEASMGVPASPSVNSPVSPFTRATVHRHVTGTTGHGALDLTVEAVEQVLEEVRPFLIADGGNVQVTGVEESGTVHLRLEGACAGCPSAGATMAMGVEQCLRGAFGPAIRDIQLN